MIATSCIASAHRSLNYGQQVAPVWVLITNDIIIGSAVFPKLTVVTNRHTDTQTHRQTTHVGYLQQWAASGTACRQWELSNYWVLGWLIVHGVAVATPKNISSARFRKHIWVQSNTKQLLSVEDYSKHQRDTVMHLTTIYTDRHTYTTRRISRTLTMVDWL